MSERSPETKMIRKPYRRWIILLVVLCVVAFIGYRLSLELGDTLADLKERDQITRLSRGFGDRLVETLDGARVFVDKPLASLVPADIAVDARFKQEYIYRPITPLGRRIAQDPASRQFVLWSPCADRSGMRLFMTGGFAGLRYRDSEVSWLFQKLRSDLTPSEKEIEDRSYASGRPTTSVSDAPKAGGKEQSDRNQ
jgi:hypothetical protein